MTLILHAQPYDLAAAGFYFETTDEYHVKADALRNDYGEPVEEFELQFIDGDLIDCELAKAWGLHQGNFEKYLDACEEWDEHQKRCFIIAVGECGYSFDPQNADPDSYDVDIYECDCLRDLAVQFVDEGLFGEFPERLAFYLDYDAIARDLSFDYAQTEIDGTRLIYRCG